MSISLDAASLGVLSSPQFVIAIALVVAAAAVVQVGLGMGFGLTAAPLLALIDPSLVPAPTLFLGMLTAAWAARAEYRSVQWSEVGLAVIGRLAGVAGGAAVLLVLVDRKTFTLIFGLLIAAAVVLSASGLRLHFTRPRLLAMGAASGLLGTLTSIGAPPIALIYQDRPATKARPTLSAFFAIGCAISLAGLFVSGWAGWNDVVLAGLMLPPMLAGLLIARLLKGRFDRRYRPALLAISGIAALMLIARGFA